MTSHTSKILARRRAERIWERRSWDIFPEQPPKSEESRAGEPEQSHDDWIDEWTE